METRLWKPEYTSDSERTHTFDFTLSFNKESNDHWYVDIPYNGPHWDLRMVSGTDCFLEALAKRGRRVTVRFCDHDFEGCEHRWHATKKLEGYGRTYHVDSSLYEGTAWLCPVMKYVLGFYPDHIYVKHIG